MRKLVAQPEQLTIWVRIRPLIKPGPLIPVHCVRLIALLPMQDRVNMVGAFVVGMLLHEFMGIIPLA